MITLSGLRLKKHFLDCTCMCTFVFFFKKELKYLTKLGIIIWHQLSQRWNRHHRSFVAARRCAIWSMLWKCLRGKDVFLCLTYAIDVMFQTGGPLAAFVPFEIFGRPTKPFKTNWLLGLNVKMFKCLLSIRWDLTPVIRFLNETVFANSHLLPLTFYCFISKNYSVCYAEVCDVGTMCLWKQLFSHVDKDSDWLRAGWSGDRIPVGLRPVRTGSGAHPVSCPLLEVKRPGRGIDHPLHLALRLKKV